jgi:riboflavin kinase / FMN adenylyltransferase
MRIDRGPIGSLRPQPDSVLTLGSFDGVHLGHARLVRRVVQRAREAGLASSLVTFEPHPRRVLGDPRGELALLTPLDEKLALLARLGLDRAVVLEFTPGLAALDARRFICEGLRPHLGFRRLVIGYNHAFGRGRSGNRETLSALGAELGFEVEVLPPVLVDGQAVHSTRIRQLLEAGQVDAAARLLGRPYRLIGEVVPGAGRGRRLGFPTANLRLIDGAQLQPAAGVYAVRRVSEQGVQPGMMNLGARPTFGESDMVPEVHLFNDAGEAYGEVWHLDILHRVRDIVRFDSAEALQAQLLQDRQRIQGWLAEAALTLDDKETPCR